MMFSLTSALVFSMAGLELKKLNAPKTPETDIHFFSTAGVEHWGLVAHILTTLFAWLYIRMALFADSEVIGSV